MLLSNQHLSISCGPPTTMDAALPIYNTPCPLLSALVRDGSALVNAVGQQGSFLRVRAQDPFLVRSIQRGLEADIKRIGSIPLLDPIHQSLPSGRRLPSIAASAMRKAWHLEEAEVVLDVRRDLGDPSVIVDGALCWNEIVGL
jgi:hypothetical protein